MNFTKLTEKIPVYVTCLFLFGLTMFPKLLTILLVVLCVVWIVEGDFRRKFSFLATNRIYLILPALFVMYLIGMSYTTNTSYGWKKVETALALLIIPVVFPTLKVLRSSVNYSLFRTWYLNGIFFSALFCILRSIILFAYELYCRRYNITLDDYPYTNYFFSSYLSYFMHYGYYAMYVNVGIVLLLESTREKFSALPLRGKLGSVLLIFSLSVYVLMLYSKAAILCLLMIYLFYGIYLTLLYKKKQILVYTFVSMAALIFVLFKYVPYTAERLQGMFDGIRQEALDPASTESTQLRIFAWKASKELIIESPLFGYGTGDGNYVLMERYRQRNYTGVLSTETNSHNQYFQTMLSIGILGLAILLFFYTKMLQIAFHLKSFELFAFPVLTAFVLLFESYFSTQAGIFFLSALSVLLLMKYFTLEQWKSQ